MSPNTLSELEKRLQYGTQDASTASTKSQRTTQSSEPFTQMTLHGRWTEPTSQHSDSFEIIYKENIQEKHEEPSPTQSKRADSDLEAQYGSDSIHSWGSAESASNRSDDSRNDLPRPTQDIKMKAIGGHFEAMIPQWEEPTVFPNNDTEARILMDRIKRACATTHAADNFKSHLQPDAVPELSLHRQQISGSWVKRRFQPIHKQQYPPTVDIEHQRHRRRRHRKTMFVLAIVLVFAILSLVLYINFYMI